MLAALRAPSPTVHSRAQGQGTGTHTQRAQGTIIQNIPPHRVVMWYIPGTRTRVPAFGQTLLI